MRGRRPKQTAVKILEGNPGKRRLNAAEMQPEPGVPDPPEVLNLDPVALDEWNRIAPQLAALGVLTRLDAVALSAYCMRFARMIESQKLIDRYGMLLLEGKKIRRNPAIRFWNDALRELLRWGVEFGLTPASRSRIRIEKPQEEDALDQFLRRGTTPARVN
jgi:P27 family predicted phage terminase small subunit